MAQRVDDSHRRVVPRWWSVPVASSLGQLGTVIATQEPSLPSPEPGELDELRRDWERYPSAVYAASLIDAALAFDQHAIAADAAEWVIRNGGVSDVSLRLAKVLLSTDLRPPEVATEVTLRERWKAVAEHRRRLRLYPRDSLRWVELARHYSALGQIESARKALTIGVSLAPNSRYVLRSASRFHLHAHDPEQAHRVLLNAPAVGSDPWLMAAEIVAAEARGATSRLIKSGTAAVHSGRFEALSVSELASALGTLEFKSGHKKNTRRLFARAMEDPTENTLAQAEWVSRHSANFCPPDPGLDVPRASEAHAWQALAAEDYNAAVDHSFGWLRDEPFASRPALMGSWIAAVALEDYGAALRFVDSALVANPEDVRLVIQQVYCLASSDRVEEAAARMPLLEAAAARGDGTYTAAGWEALLNADRGLLAYRRGSVEEGRAAYHEAIEVASSNRLSEAAASALINFAREEARLGIPMPIGTRELEQTAAAFPPACRGAVLQFVARLGLST